ATYVGSTGQFAVGNSNTLATRLDVVYSNINNSVNGYATSCTKNLTSGATSSLTCKIVAPVGASACSGGFTLDSDLSASTNAGPIGGVTAVAFVAGVTGVPQSGWTNFAPALTATTFSNGGVEPLSNGETCDGSNGKECAYDRHIHQYDDTYDVTGVNMLNPSDSNVNIVRAIPSLQQKFKVIVHNQYLSPAVRLHIGNPSYLPDVDFGYTSLKNYTSSPTLDLSTLQTYKRDPNAVWPGAAVTPAQMAAQAKPIGSLVFNMPLDALTPKNWWGNGDVRVGLHPTIPQCMWKSAGVNDGNMYQPVNPPVNGVDGPGTKGWSSSTPITTQTSATGARHNGALTIQIIRDTTPNTAIELNVAGRPEYGWRVKAVNYTAYVLAEYSTYWHHPNGKCYNSAGWTKTPDADTGGSTLAAKAAGSTDPKLGDLSAGSAGGGSGGSGSGGGVSVTSVTVTTVGAVTTTVITYADGTSATIVRTANSDGTVTIVTTDALGNVTTQTIANKDGSLLSGGDERGLQARTGRVSWRELIKP
ncbi:MAG: hypothetical protein ABI907_04335, partial [Ramlibacter sp.]